MQSSYAVKREDQGSGNAIILMLHQAYIYLIATSRSCKTRLFALKQIVQPLCIKLATMLMNCCCCLCICCFRAFTTLTEDDKGRYYKLREQVKVIHRLEDSRYQQILANLYRYSFLKDRGADGQSPVVIDPEKWPLLGFQSTEPFKDLRGGGLMALHQLSRLMQDCPKQATEMVTLTRQNLFLLACNSIRATTFLRRVFEFDTEDCLDKTTCSLSKRSKKFKNLAIFLGQDNSGERLTLSEHVNLPAFDRLHQLVLLEILKEWKLLLRERPDITILQISLAERPVEAKFIKFIEQRIYTSLSAFADTVRAAPCAQLSEAELSRPRDL